MKRELCEERICHFRSEIQQGGFGNVTLLADTEGNLCALKQQKMMKSGIPCPLEASILFSYSHPNLMNAKGFEINSTHLNLFLDFSEKDLFDWRKGLKDDLPSIAKITPWIFQLADAIGFLHDRKILHGDIKMENILIFKNEIKLSDFSLSRFFGEYQGEICTMTHRPPQSLLGEKWDEKCDSWGFGCTLFEILYGCSPFPYQENEKAMLNTIRIFLNRVSEKFLRVKETLEITSEPCEEPYYGHKNLFLEKPTELHRLIISCLRWDPKKRPTFQEILQSKIFINHKKAFFKIDSPPLLPLKEELEVRRKFENYYLDERFSDICYLIYNRSFKILGAEKLFRQIYDEFKPSVKIEIKEEYLIEACVRLATKILRTPKLKSLHPQNQIDYYEILICRYLQFRLHSAYEIYRFQKHRLQTF